MRPFKPLAAAVLAVPALLLGATAAAAHPLGNLSVNTYDGVVVTPSGVRVDHVEDLAELPALAAVKTFDRNGNGTLDGAETSAAGTARCAEAARRTTVRVDGRPLAVVPGTALVSASNGQAGLPLLRLECTLTAAVTLPAGSHADVAVDVTAAADIGWREITLSGDGVRVDASSVPARTVSGRLTAYPADLRAHQPDVRSARASVTSTGSGGVAAQSLPGGAAPVGGALGGAVGRLTAAVESRIAGGGMTALLVLVLGAALLGVLHAAAPGHGKTVIAAAAVARTERTARGRVVRDALALGGTVTAAHTASVLVVGGLLAVAGKALPGRVFPLLGVVSGVLVVALGVALLRGSGPWRHTHDEGGGHGHGHGQGHSHGHGHGHAHGHGHEHASGHGHEHAHEHAGQPRRHLLVGLGLAGGLTPSPTALLLLLGAVAAGRTIAGLLAVVAFGIGMATALTAVGLAAAAGRIRLSGWASGRPASAVTARLAAVLPRLAGLGVVGGGSLLVVRGLAQVAGL